MLLQLSTYGWTGETITALVLHHFTVVLVVYRFFRLPFTTLGLHTRARQVGWFPMVSYFVASKKAQGRKQMNHSEFCGGWGS